MKFNALLAFSLLTVCTCLFAQDHAFRYDFRPKEKKVIFFGWAEPKSIAHFNSDLKDLDDCPVDGIGIRPVFQLKRGDKTIPYAIARAKGATQTLTKEDLEPWIAPMKRLQSTRLKHNFILTGSVLFNADWFDDDAWKQTLNNFAMLAWLAKEADFKGLALDIEPYAHSGLPLMFRPNSGHDFEETQRQVRKRAAQWTKCINDNFPGITLFTFFWASQCDSPEKATLPQLNYGSAVALQTAFFNGVYDAAPCNMTIIDGNESAGYNAVTPGDFAALQGRFLKYAKAWIDPVNHDKFDRITQLAAALYLDSYIPNPKAATWRHFSYTDNPAQLLADNIRHGLEISDEYAWIWGEKGTFWPKLTKSQTCPNWNDLLPYTKEAILAGKATDEFLIQNYGTKLLKNGGLNEDKSPKATKTKLPVPGWNVYFTPGMPKGTVTAENGTVRLVNCASACISQSTKNIREGQHVLVIARVKNESRNAIPTLSYFFRDRNAKGIWTLNRQIPFADADDGWLKAWQVVTIPKGQDIVSMHVTCGAQSTPSENQEDKGIVIDNVEIYTLSFPWE